MFFFLVLASLLLQGCASFGNTKVKDAVVRDWIFSVETRVNGVTTVWLRNDDTGVYCFTNDIATAKQLEDLMKSDRMVTFRYGDVKFFNNNPCSGAEVSVDGSGFHTFVVTQIVGDLKE